MKNNRLITFLLILTLFTLMTEMEDKIRNHASRVIDGMVANVEIESSDKATTNQAIPLTVETKSLLQEGFDSVTKVLINN